MKSDNSKILQNMNEHFDTIHSESRKNLDVVWTTRLRRLEKLESLVNENRHVIAEVINQDFGRRSKSETLMFEIVPTLEEIRHAKKHGKDWMKTKKVHTSMWFLPASSYIKPQPLGVIGIIAPWNYPLFLSLGPLIGALVAGNRAMIKISEYTPLFAEWLFKTLPEYFTSDEVSVTIGDSKISQAFSALPFDHLIFTGSTAVGKHVMKAAAENLTPVTLELGGKSPVIIDKNCDLAHAVNRIWTGKLINAGQTCVAPDYVLIPESLQDDFINQSKMWISKHYEKIEDNEDFSYLINQLQFTRIQSYIDNAKSTDAVIHYLTNVEANVDTHFMPPIAVSNLNDDSDLLQDEIFAPILPMVTYHTIEDAIQYVNNRARPLALYLFSKDESICNKVLAETISGGVSINDTIYHIAQNELPFGGVGDSGMGRYHGKFGFDTFSHQKSIFKQANINAMSFIQPPYGKSFNRMMRLLVKD